MVSTHSVQFSHSVMSESLWPHGLQHARPPCPSPTQLISDIQILFSCLVMTLSNPVDCSMPGFPILHHLLELSQTHVHWVSDAIQPSYPLSSTSTSALNLSQHQGLFQWVSYLNQVTKVLEFQLQPQSFQWIFRVDFL